jgi:hypothetical protein
MESPNQRAHESLIPNSRICRYVGRRKLLKEPLDVRDSSIDLSLLIHRQWRTCNHAPGVFRDPVRLSALKKGRRGKPPVHMVDRLFVRRGSRHEFTLPQ